MAEFKSSFMGGYKKKSVDEYVGNLESENENLKKALDLAEHNALKADKYFNENKQLCNEIGRLNTVIDELNEKLAESEQSNNDYIANIGQIFYSAYESGAKITEDAQSGSQEFLQKIENASATAKEEAQKAINAYNLINTDIKALLNNLTKEINAVSANTDNMIKKATQIAEAMDDIQSIKTVNANKAKVIKEEYKEFFDSFSEASGKAEKQAPATKATESAPEVKPVEEVAAPVQAEPTVSPILEVKKAEPAAPTSVKPVEEKPRQAQPAPAVAQDDSRNAMLRDILKKVSNQNS